MKGSGIVYDQLLVVDCKKHVSNVAGGEVGARDQNAPVVQHERRVTDGEHRLPPTLAHHTRGRLSQEGQS